MAHSHDERFGLEEMTKEERIRRNKEALELGLKEKDKEIEKIKKNGWEKKDSKWTKVIESIENAKKQMKRDTQNRIWAIENDEEKPEIHMAPVSKENQKKRLKKKDK